MERVKRIMSQTKRILKHSVAAVTIIVIAVMLEILVFNKNAIMYPEYTSQYRQKEAGTEGFATRKYGDKKASIIVLNRQYVNKMSLRFDSENDFSYTIELTANNKFDKEVKRTINDKSYEKLAKTHVNIAKKVTKIKIIYPKDVTLNEIQINNQFSYNWIRILFVMFTLGIIYIIATCRRIVSEHIEYVFLIASVSLGLIMVIALPENLQSWDEHIHFNRAYTYSYNDTVEYSQSAWMLKTLAVPVVDTIEDKYAVQSLLDYYDTHGDVVKEVDKDTNFISYSGRAYILQAFALWFARTCGMNFSSGLIMARMLNLFMYIIVMFLAIKYARHGKRILTLIGMLPTSIFIASSFSYDAFVTEFLALGFVFVVNEFTDTESKLNWKRIAVGVTAIAVGSFVKAVYVPLMLFLCFLPKEKFENTRQKVMFKLSIVIVFLVMMSTFVLPALTNATSGTDTGGDKRGGDTSVTRQLTSVVTHPVEYTELLVETIVRTAPDYILGYQNKTFFAYLRGDSGVWFYMCLIVLVFVALTEGTMERYLPLKRKEKIALTAGVACVVCLIWTALYLDFTPVGLYKINGVQPRYYIPLLFPISIVIENGRIRCHRVSEFRYNQVVSLGAVLVLAGMIYQYILEPCCF